MSKARKPITTMKKSNSFFGIINSQNRFIFIQPKNV